MPSDFISILAKFLKNLMTSEHHIVEDVLMCEALKFGSHLLF